MKPHLIGRLCLFLALSLIASAAFAASARSGDDEALPEGRYALVMDVVADANVPVLGGVRSSTKTLALLDVRRDGDRLIARQDVCDVELGPDQGIARTVFPERLVRALPERSYVLDVTPATDGARVRADLGIDTLGYDPDKSGGRLPTSRDDPGLVDVDGDGRPGATLFLEVKGAGRFPLEVVSRGRTVLEGRVVGPGRATGTARLVEYEQKVLGGLPVQGAVRGVEGRTAESRFVLERVDDGARCGDLKLDDKELGYQVAGR